MRTKVYSLSPSVPVDTGSLKRLSSQVLSKLSTLKEMKAKDVTKVTYPVTNVLSILHVGQLALQELKRDLKTVSFKHKTGGVLSPPSLLKRFSIHKNCDFQGV